MSRAGALRLGLLSALGFEQQSLTCQPATTFTRQTLQATTAATAAPAAAGPTAAPAAAISPARPTALLGRAARAFSSSSPAARAADEARLGAPAFRNWARGSSSGGGWRSPAALGAVAAAGAVALCFATGQCTLGDAGEQLRVQKEQREEGHSLPYPGGVLPGPGASTPPDKNPYGHPDPNQQTDAAGLPILACPKATAPNVPPPILRTSPAHLVLELVTTTQELNVSPLHKYTFWTFDGTVPGPIIRARVGDVLEVRYTNKDRDGIGHNIDFHAVEGPGGGASVTYAEEGETKVATFKLLFPGLFAYHCAAAPLPTHVANGMYGLVLVEPEGGLPPVDKEFYVLQSEVYAEESGERGVLDHSYSEGLVENPMYVVLNGAQGALTEKAPLQAEQGDTVRIYFGNAGPNLSSSFHVIGTLFHKLYREGDLVSPPARYVSTTSVPPGGSCAVELHLPVPGNYTLLDHALFRVDKGCVGFLKVRAKGPDRRRDIYDSVDPPNPCPGCKLHN